MKFIQCQSCGKLILEDSLPWHMDRVHGSPNKKTRNKANSDSAKKSSKQNIKNKNAKSTTAISPQVVQNKNLNRHCSTILTSPEPCNTDTLSSPKTLNYSGLKPTKASRLHPSSKDQYADNDGFAVCVLCKTKILAEKMEEHLTKDHRVSASQKIKSLWVHIFQGGLPGLGKRSR